MNRLWIILLTFFFSLVFWESPFLFPLKMLSVLIHELWHSLIAMFFNVDWIQFHIFEDESAKTMVKGNISPIGFILTTSAGYIGTVLTASVFLRAFIIQELEELYYFIFTILLLIVSFVFIPLGTLAFKIAFLFSIGMILLYFFNKNLSYYMFTIILSFILFYSVYDLLDFSKNPYKSDVGILYYFLNSKKIYHGDPKNFVSAISIFWSSIHFYLIYKIILYPLYSKNEVKLDFEQQKEDITIPENNENITKITDNQQNNEVKLSKKQEIDFFYNNKES
jgi:hypothetical protein